jgi:adenine-specific DNA-methyltransferase
MFDDRRIADKFSVSEDIVVFPGDCLELLQEIPDRSLGLVITSPPYNIGKEYEKRLKLETYLKQQAAVIGECARCLSPHGSICCKLGTMWTTEPLYLWTPCYTLFFTSLGLRMRNRIIWHFEAWLALQPSVFRHDETIIWFTKSDKYTFNLDPVRVATKISRQETL